MNSQMNVSILFTHLLKNKYMTNIEKVKRILDAGHWVKVTYKDGTILNITSNYKWISTYINPRTETVSSTSYNFKDCTIEVIQRIPTPYKPGDKVLVLSNPSPICTDSKHIDMMVWKICEIRRKDGFCYAVFNEDKTDYWIFPAHCLAPAFEEEEISDLDRIISGMEAKIVIDGKEYTCVIK